MKKETQKLLTLTLFVVIAISVLASFTAAQSFSEGFNSFIDGIDKALSPVLGRLLGDSATGGELTIQILAFLLVTLVVYGVLGMAGIFGNKHWINMAIGAIVAVLGIRFLPPGFLEQAAIPSSAFVAVLIMGIPFILLFFIMKGINSSSARRAIWAAYGVLILILWIYNYNNADIPPEAKWIYPAIAIGCGIAFWFDGTLAKWWGTASAKRTVETGTNVNRDIVVGEIAAIEKRLINEQDPAQKTRLKAEIAAKKAVLKDF